MDVVGLQLGRHRAPTGDPLRVLAAVTGPPQDLGLLHPREAADRIPVTGASRPGSVAGESPRERDE
jgi:hypothetical protein